jgi:uncharacterized protein YkwD
MALGRVAWRVVVGLVLAAVPSALWAQSIWIEVPPDRAPSKAPGKPSSNTPGLSPRERQHLMDLSKAALGPDAAASAAAIKELQALGEPAKPRLAAVVRELLVRDRTLIGSAERRLGSSEKAQALADEFAALRASALDNIAKLDKGERMTVAHENYDKLAKMQATMGEAGAIRLVVRAAAARRPALLDLWKQVGEADDPKFSPANEEKVKAETEAVLGMPLAAALAIPEFGRGKEPADPAARQLWFYDACRRIEAWNRTLTGQMSAAEWENLALLNAYRESLGTLPPEADARILQSARRHSREMADKGYFAHESPTPSEKTHVQRMKNAGYNNGYSENIAAGSSTGKGVFWMWFGSPPHHQNMVHAGSTGFGVGAWGSMWTQNFGGGKRVMLMDPAERARQVVLGLILAPQGALAARPGPGQPGG